MHEIQRPSHERLEYSYTVDGEWSRFFDLSNPMWVEYDHSVADVPDSIAVIPLIGNFIVLASLMDAVIYVDEIDKDFYDSVEEFIDGYDRIMPDSIHFKHQGLISAKKIVNTPFCREESRQNLLFFSGGVDATSSLIHHLDEKPALVSIWGADISWENTDGWDVARQLNQNSADRFGLELLTIHSNFRRAYDDDYVNDYSMEISNDWWWSAFHHSVAMMCLAAPIAAGTRKKLYFGSTYSEKDLPQWGTYVTASDPLIDNHVRFCGCQVIHDGYEFSRYDKIRNIYNFFKQRKEKYFLRVCYLSNTGKNCGHCEKCASAAMGIRLAGGNPKDFGIDISDEDLPKYFIAGIQEMGREEKYAFMSFYYDIQAEYIRQHTPDQVPPVMRIFYESDLSHLADSLLVPCNEVNELRSNVLSRQNAMYQEQAQLQQDWNRRMQEQKEQTQMYQHLLEQARQETEEKQQLLQQTKLEAEAEYRILEQAKIHADIEQQRLRSEIDKLKKSNSWRMTAPLRNVMSALRGKKNHTEI